MSHSARHSQLTGVVTALTGAAVILRLTLAMATMARAVVAADLPILRIPAAIHFCCAKRDFVLFLLASMGP